MEVRRAIHDALLRSLVSLGIEGVAPVLEHPADVSNGDYATSVALAAAKAAKKSPKALAEEVVAVLLKDNLLAQAGVAKLEVAGPGFINFYLSRAYFGNSIADIAAIGKDWGKNALLKGKKVMVEYSQPNPFKPFHIGHLMSTTVGESISRLIEWSGPELFRANYQGDIGPHVAKCLWGIERTGKDPHDVIALGEAYAFGHEAYESDESARSEIDFINAELYKGSSQYQTVYDIGRTASLQKFDALYRLLGTTFDGLFFESMVAGRGAQMVADGLAAGIFEESDGAIVYRGEKCGLHTRVFITKNGTPTYEAKELGLAEAKYATFPFDLNVTTVASEQDGYFTVVRAALSELRPDIGSAYLHVPFGMLLLTTGKMSSRKGNVITGESLIETMRVKALERMQERDLGDEKELIADAVAVAAIKFSILKQGTGKNIIFDPTQSLSLEGDSGPYLQYAHTRARSVLERARAERIQPSSAMLPDGITVLERLLYRFPEVVERAMVEYEPHYVTTFLTELAGAFNSWYAGTKIVDPSDPYSPYKIAITEAFLHTMKNGLWLLGIQAPDRM